ncbi:hypothetical protein [Shewanella cyperi]|uniref:Uncharacterized protein n=1 Tax=Shewanella cyperi TaxID=2814292 RepID=A0A974XHG9_9GAMM|nr:hypothetical protein [Shewanella cyperi]QSX28490.1 hypothetical protein JYB88_09225 [Shewanella cyperi]QSX39250.1 hypothetical protein JYB84_09220 [Shewanella cyperi]
MTAIQIGYEDARARMRPGDVIAFGGKAAFSNLTKFATRSHVSHVGVILQTKVVNDSSDRFFNQIIESTELNDFTGVQISRFSDRLDYDGEIWWLPLDPELRETRFNEAAFYEFLFNQAKARKPFDVPQALLSAFDLFDDFNGPGYNQEDFAKFFCSELVAAGFEAAGMTGTINCSEVTPIDLCRWRIYQDNYYQLKGAPDKGISRFNSLAPALWDK